MSFVRLACLDRWAPAFKVGTTRAQRLIYLQPDEVTPVDLTGYTVEVEILDAFEASVALTCSETSGHLQVEALTGVIQWVLSDEEMLSYEGRKVRLMLTEGSGIRYSLIDGYILVGF